MKKSTIILLLIPLIVLLGSNVWAGKIYPLGTTSAAGIYYDPTISGLTSTNVKGALDEVAGSKTAAGVTYSNATSGLTAIEVQSAIDELDTTLDGLVLTANTTGDVTSVGDCLGGACGDGTSDGGTYLRLYGGATTKYTQLTPSNTAADAVVTFPTATSTLATIGLAETITGIKTYTNSVLKLLGSSTGATTFTSANSSGTNYVATIPANTGTIAELNLAQTWTAAQGMDDLLTAGGINFDTHQG